MRQKLTFLMAVLLLAVGWSSSASAQAIPQGGYAERLGLASVTATNGTKDTIKKAQKMTSEQGASSSTRMNAPRRADANPEMVSLTRAQAEELTYKWTDADGVQHESKATDDATNPYQMYELLRFVYGNPAFPGPRFTAWSNDNNRERAVYYGPMQGGWDLVAAGSGVQTGDDIVITVASGYVGIKSIYVYNGTTALTYWVGGTGSTVGSSPSSWVYDTNTTYNATCRWVSNGDGSWWLTYGDNTGGAGGKITIPYSALQGSTQVRVVINTKTDDGYTQNDGVTTEQGDITVNGETQNIAETAFMDYTWELTVAEQPEEGEYVQGTVAAPSVEGYTALIVSVKDDATPMTETYNSYDNRNSILLLNSKAEIIDYFTQRVNYIKLLTDGMRIGKNEDYSRGTVFNCTGTYNKFFILGKGQSRQKDSYILNTLEPYYGTMGEEGPFKYMFEEFSPVQPDIQNEITDFYKKMMEGSTYNVAHDCASVIQNGHQFSMTGNSGTESYYLSGLNFFYPDYRLKYWTTTYSGYTVDGRTMNPYFSITGSSGTNGFRDCPSYCAHFAQYNQTYAPKMGIYKITLDAEAEKNPDKDHTYNVTLTWVSSLNEMSGHEVDQLYTMYIVDENGDTTKINPTQVVNLHDADGNSITTNPCTVTQVIYEVPQNEHSYTIVYQIRGQENTAGEPAFVALSNLDDVIIPGWNDFLALGLDHYESDFKITEEKNWYRNFLLVANENDDNALTVKKIGDGQNVFKLYRYNVIPASSGEMNQIATLTFKNPTPTQVQYVVKYVDENGSNTQEILDYTLKNANGQTVKEHAYEREQMQIPDSGYLRVVGNGDLIIYPNGYHVNFKSIRVYDGTTLVTSWTAPTSTTGTSNLPGTWGISPGSIWEPFTTDANDRVYYVEGGGYIYIPNMLTSHSSLRVVINAYGDGASLPKITVNDVTKTIANNTAADYEWTVTANRGDRYLVDTYQKVTSTADLTDGEYLIVCENNSVAFNGGLTSLDTGHNTIDVTIENGEIAADDAVNAATFTLTSTGSGNYSIKSKSGYYIGRTSNSNGMNTSLTQAYNNAITISNGNATITGYINNGLFSDTYYNLRFNSSSGNNNYRFRYYSSSQQNVQLYKKVQKDVELPEAMVRLGHLHIVDQFTASTAKNDHPRRYGYVLRYEPEQGDPQQSGSVEVPVLHSNAVVNGYYTTEDVASDIDRHLEKDVMNADVTMNLPTGEPDLLHYRLHGTVDGLPVNDTFILSKMQQSSGRYREMDATSPLYVADEEFTYPAGALEYFLPEPAVTGKYATNYITYAPSTTTWGIDRRYYEIDNLDNSYGAPIWKTGVGQARIISTEAQMQRGPQGSTQWEDNDGNACSLYFLGLESFGDLPSTEVSNIKYEPYMFRVWIYSPSGKLRGCTYYPANQGNDPNKPGAHWEGDGTSFTGPYMIYEGETTDGHLIKQLQGMEEGNNEPWNQKLQFGAVDNIDDLVVYVRFYYKSTGDHVNVPTTNMLMSGNRAEVPAFYAVEGSEDETGVTTSINSVYDYTNKTVESVTYVNTLGMESDQPFEGVNIVVTRYSDGKVSTTKVLY